MLSHLPSLLLLLDERDSPVLHGFLAEPPGNPRRFCSSSPRLSSTAINYYVRLDGGRKKRVFRVRGGGGGKGRRIIPCATCSRPLKVSGRRRVVVGGLPSKSTMKISPLPSSLLYFARLPRVIPEIPFNVASLMNGPVHPFR